MPILTEAELLYREVRHLVGSTSRMPQQLTLEDVQTIMNILKGFVSRNNNDTK